MLTTHIKKHIHYCNESWLLTYDDDSYIMININNNKQYDISKYIYKNQPNNAVKFSNLNDTSCSHNNQLFDNKILIMCLDTNIYLITYSHTAQDLLNANTFTLVHRIIKLTLTKKLTHTHNTFMKMQRAQLPSYITFNVNINSLLIRVRNVDISNILSYGIFDLASMRHTLIVNDAKWVPIPPYLKQYTCEQKCITCNYVHYDIENTFYSSSNIIPINLLNDTCMLVYIDKYPFKKVEYKGQLLVSRNPFTKIYNYILTYNNEKQLLHPTNVKLNNFKSNVRFSLKINSTHLGIRAHVNKFDEYHGKLELPKSSFIQDIKTLHEIVEDAINKKNDNLDFSYTIDKSVINVNISIKIKYIETTLCCKLIKYKCKDRLALIEKKVDYILDEIIS